MATAEQQVKEFQRLAGEAQAGNLYIDSVAATQLAKVCMEYMNELRTLTLDAADLVRIESFSDLDSSAALGRKFYDLAVGGAGSGSYTMAIADHLKILEAMHDMYIKAGAAFDATDADTQAKIKAQTHKIDW
ncbi:hypothetical protein [Nocardia sp. NPDC048505]|uniref:hypothetical protein n=1 Tax=unclassified Nocardia TaxID=2637762 RepID=UPI0033CBE808